MKGMGIGEEERDESRWGSCVWVLAEQNGQNEWRVERGKRGGGVGVVVL